jgi:microsomal epoxide hydrolase
MLHMDRRQREAWINSFPHFKAPVKDDDGTVYDIHFVALFSKKKDALPLVFLHGWAGSFLEFLKILKLLKEKYTPETLPYHVIVPSIPGFAFSSLPILERTFTVQDTVRIFDKLVSGLGFGKFVVQGGDLGSILAKYWSFYPNCAGTMLFLCVSDRVGGADLGFWYSLS